MNHNDNDTIYSSENAGTLERIKNTRHRLRENKPTKHKELDIILDKPRWSKFLSEIEKTMTIVHFCSWEGNAFESDTGNSLRYSPDDSTVNLDIFGDEEFIDKITALVEKVGLVIFENYMQWYYNEKGQSVKIPIHREKLPCTEMYPFLGDETLEEYYQRFSDSDSSILLLIGPPGTGKTSFLKGLLSYTESSASISYNIDVLNDDAIFVNFLTGDTQHMIMEDCDTFLEERSEGNTMMHRFLNVSDGLVSVKGKKIIFTTNLANTNHIDEALIRPGRCFDILHFNHLTKEQAEKLATKAGVKLTIEKDGYTIADIFAGGLAHQDEIEEHNKSRKIGFGV